MPFNRVFFSALSELTNYQSPEIWVRAFFWLSYTNFRTELEHFQFELGLFSGEIDLFPGFEDELDHKFQK